MPGTAHERQDPAAYHRDAPHRRLAGRHRERGTRIEHLDHLVELIQKAIFAAVTSVAPGLLKKVTDASQDATDFHDVGFNSLDAHRHPTSVFTAKSIEFDFKLAKTYH